MSIYVDTIEGAHGKLTNKGWELYRTFKTNGLSAYSGPLLIPAGVAALGSPFYDANGTLQQPVQIGFPHPGQPTATCQEMSPKALATDVVQVDCTYREVSRSPNAPKGTIRVGASIAQVQTNLDYVGTPIVVNYTGNKISAEGWRKIGELGTRDQSKLFSSPRPEGTVHVSRQETGSPGDKSKMYVGATNTAGWLIDPAAPARNWLCTGIVGTTKDMVIFEVDYDFQRAPPGPNNTAGTWDKGCFWIDPGTGAPPPDASEANGGKKIVQDIPSLDFNPLGLA